MARFRKKPVVIEAIQYTGHNDYEVIEFVQGHAYSLAHPKGEPDSPPVIIINTLEGNMTARVNDWIIRGVSGEFYPCKPDIFEATYEPVD